MPNFGRDTTGGDSFPPGDGRIIVSRFTTSEAGTMTRGWAWFDEGASGSISAKVVVYTAGAAFRPGTLVAASAGAAISGAGLNDLGAISGSLADATDYYVGVVWNGGGDDSVEENFSYDAYDTAMDNGNDYASPTAFTGTPSEYNSVQVCAYVVYTAAGGAVFPFGSIKQRRRGMGTILTMKEYNDGQDLHSIRGGFALDRRGHFGAQCPGHRDALLARADRHEHQFRDRRLDRVADFEAHHGGFGRDIRDALTDASRTRSFRYHQPGIRLD